MQSSSNVRSGIKISIVTPSFNQGAYLDETIQSVLGQNYRNLEYAVVDGGSTDGSVEIIQRHSGNLSWWVSEKDRGHYDAVNKGFERTSGEVMAWINSDDKYLPWTFSTVAEVMTALPQVEWLTSRFHFFWDAEGRASRCEEHPGFSSRQVLKGGTLPGCGWPAWTFIQQESTFWRRSLWDRCGGRLKGERFPLAGDFELWMRFAKETQLYYVDLPLGGFRKHDLQQTATRMNDYLSEARRALLDNGGTPPGTTRSLWLKNSAKLLRFLHRRHSSACGQTGAGNHVVYSSESARWTISAR